MLEALVTKARRWLGPDEDPPLQALKRWVIDVGVRRAELRSVADLGGVWAVEGGYSRYAAGRPSVEEVVLVDTGITDTMERLAAGHPELRLVHGDIGRAEVLEHVGSVDGLLMFDLLLHQVAPDWDEVLAMWTPGARAVLIVQPIWLGERTVRLVELGEERYRQVVPDEPNARRLFSRLDDIHPRYGRPWRDVHEVWQWGITDTDLRRAMADLGFRIVAYVDDGPWRDSPWFGNHAYVFLREDDDPSRRHLGAGWVEDPGGGGGGTAGPA